MYMVVLVILIDHTVSVSMVNVLSIIDYLVKQNIYYN